jgi:hypothetical protein
MKRTRRDASVRATTGGELDMQALSTVIVFIFVIGVLGTVAFALFEITPFARHRDRFRDPRTGKRLGESPRLD